MISQKRLLFSSLLIFFYSTVERTSFEKLFLIFKSDQTFWLVLHLFTGVNSNTLGIFNDFELFSIA